MRIESKTPKALQITPQKAAENIKESVRTSHRWNLPGSEEVFTQKPVLKQRIPSANRYAKVKVKKIIVYQTLNENSRDLDHHCNPSSQSLQDKAKLAKSLTKEERINLIRFGPDS